MNKVIIKTQQEWDNLPKAFDTDTVIEIRYTEVISIYSVPERSTVYAHNSSTVNAYNSSMVNAHNSSTVNAYDSSRVYAHNSSTVNAYDSSRVYAHNSSTVNAYNSSTVNAYNSSTVNAYNSSRVYAHNSSTVNAYSSSTVNAYNSSTVNAYNSSTVNAYNSSMVNAHNSSTVNSYEQAVIHNKSSEAQLKTWDNVTIYCYKEPKSIQSENSVNIVKDIITPSFDQWIERGKVVADGIYLDLVSSKTIGHITIYECKNNKDETIYVARNGEKYAHGKTIEEAKNDLRFKISDRDTTAYNNWTHETRATQDEMIEAYRKITGACGEGVKMFLNEIGEVDNELTIKQVIDLTKDRYGHNEFKAFFERG